MQLLILLLMVIALSWLAGRVGFRLSDQAVAVLVRGFAAWRGYSWPHGVQEEDRDSRWGRPPLQPNEPPQVKAPLTRVRPAVHAHRLG